MEATQSTQSQATAYFARARPLRKTAFISLCNESSELAQLLFAPLGLPAMASALISLEDHAAAYRQWEDTIAVHLYALHGISADRVASSMHHYSETRRDPAVLQAIRASQQALAGVVEGEAVVELPDGDVNTAAMAALLLSQVLHALSAFSAAATCILPGASPRGGTGGSSYWSRKYGCDEAVLSKLGVHVGRRAFQPVDLNHLVPAGAETCTALLLRAMAGCSKALEVSAAPTAIRFTVQQYLSLLGIHAESPEVRAALMAHVPAGCRGRYDDESAVAPGRLLDAFRVSLHGFDGSCGGEGPWAGLALSANPLVSLLLQLEGKEGGVHQESYFAVTQSVRMQERARAALEKMEENEEEEDEDEDEEDEEGGGGRGALRLINAALEGKEDREEEKEEKEEEEEEEDDEDKVEDKKPSSSSSPSSLPMLPTCLLSSLLADRASYFASAETGYLQRPDPRMPYARFPPAGERDTAEDKEGAEAEVEGEEEEEEEEEEEAMGGGSARCAMRDASHALALDPYNTKAYGLRAELHSRDIKDEDGEEEGAEDWEDCSDDDDEDDDDDDVEAEAEAEEENQEEGSEPPPTNSSPALRAAKDALAAFLLGGSTDLALAAVAEDSIRRESKGRARQVFDRRERSRRGAGGAWAADEAAADVSDASAGAAGAATLRIHKQWQVLAYLGGFDLPALGLETDADLDGEAGIEVLRECLALLEGALGEGFGGEGDEGGGEVDKGEQDEGVGEAEEEAEEEEAEEEEVPHVWTEVVIEGQGEKVPPQVPLPGPAAQFVYHGSFLTTAPPNTAASPVPSTQPTSAPATASPSQDEGTPSAAIAALLAVFQRASVQALSGVVISAAGVWVHRGQGCPRGDDGCDGQEDEEGLSGLVEGAEGRELLGTAGAPVRARLLSVASCLCYLLGHTAPALLCLHLSCRLCPLQDSHVKRGALLNDMDETRRAHEAFSRAFECGERRSRSQAQRRERGGGGGGASSSSSSSSAGLPGRGGVFLLLHMAELAANQSDFSEAVGLLEQARRANQACAKAEERAREREAAAEADAGAAQGSGALSVTASRHYDSLSYTITTLLGVTVFRIDPNSPEAALRILQPAAAAALSSPRRGSTSQGRLYLLLCLGEVQAQCGDLHGSLTQFRRAHAMDPLHPLPFVNAARSYLQLNQKVLANSHIHRAIALDPDFPQPLVDLAQSLLFQGKTAACEGVLQRALGLARHVGDIKDVVVAQLMTRLTRELQEEGLYVVQEHTEG